jgi:hypothetical protein
MPCLRLADQTEEKLGSGPQVFLPEEEADVVGVEGAKTGQGELETFEDVALGVANGERDRSAWTA